MRVNDQQLTGIGMTSQRTRNRLVQRLRERGIENQQVLEVIATTPRHIFIDEALAHRPQVNLAIPLHGQFAAPKPATNIINFANNYFRFWLRWRDNS